MRVPAHARLVRVPLDGDLPAAGSALLVRGEAHPFALTGAWAGGGALVGSQPLVTAPADADPFALLDLQPAMEAGGADAVGGGWFGFLGYGLGARLETLPPGPPRPVPLPRFALGFYDHLLRLDASGQWWFEALWSDEREAVLRLRLDSLSARLRAGVDERPVRLGAFSPSPPGGAGHMAAVAVCRERIAAGEIFQANLCLRLEGRFGGDPVDLFARGARELAPRYAGLVAGPWGALSSMSPELFLRRRGRQVLTEPIKGTAARDAGAAATAARESLAGSAKDRAENVMIVDLMRNDLGRVCEYGSVSVTELAQPRAAPGVWHLVSAVSGTLRPQVGDADLLRASFPPGSVTGAPKIRTMRVIAELEATGREAYTGAIGYASPLAGLELNVAIRTLELSGERIWLGAGGGIVADSDPRAELEECLVKARPVVEAVGGRIAEAASGRMAEAASGRMPRTDSPPGRGIASPAGPAAPVFALDGEAARPDPQLGVLETMLVRDCAAVDLLAHLGRLRESVRLLYGQDLPGDLEDRVQAAVSRHRHARLRVLAAPTPEGCVSVELEAHPLPTEAPAAGPVWLASAVLPGGLGSHKWLDRRLLAALERRLGAVALLVDLDGQVLEAAHANVWIAEGDRLVTPPLDGRLLPGTVRARLLADPPAGTETREEPMTLERLAAADAVLLSSALRGLHPATLGARPPAARPTPRSRPREPLRS
jgi:para-aminobenzoate synthetase/4-amino-4-deoxychorismate lyase